MAAGIVTFALFGMMVGLVDGRWILDTLIRVFPLYQEPVGEHDLPALRPEPMVFLTLEGTVGTLAGGGFVPLEDAEILRIGASISDQAIEVDPGGSFRFEASFPGDLSGEALATQLVIRRPGCSERRVPVTRAWLVSRRIVLHCE